MGRSNKGLTSHERGPRTMKRARISDRATAPTGNRVLNPDSGCYRDTRLSRKATGLIGISIKRNGTTSKSKRLKFRINHLHLLTPSIGLSSIVVGEIRLISL